MRKFPRKCSATGEGMEEGYCFFDGEKYFKYAEDAYVFAIRQGYNNLDEAYNAGIYYWTDWQLEDDEPYYDAEGNMYEP
jgi:hypothetical protein